MPVDHYGPSRRPSRKFSNENIRRARGEVSLNYLISNILPTEETRSLVLNVEGMYLFWQMLNASNLSVLQAQAQMR